MKRTVVSYFKLDPVKFTESGAFNIRLDIDSRLFVDPFLLGESEAAEFDGARQKLLDHFEKVLRLLLASRTTDDKTWQAARRLLSFHEQGGFNLGYSAGGVTGSGIGPQHTETLLKTAREIVEKGIVDPVIFELVGLFEEGIGADRISDMACKILLPEFLAYTSRVFTHCGFKGGTIEYRGKTYNIPSNPFRRSHPVLLTPKAFLRDLPIALSFDDIDRVVSENRELRERLNIDLGRHSRKRFLKWQLKEFLLSNPDALRELLNAYKKARPKTYDFDSDPSGEVLWREAADAGVREHPLQLSLPSNPVFNDLLGVVRRICVQYSELIEEHSWWRLLYKDNGRSPKHESASQLLFFGCAEAYCDANDLDISRESNGGRGPVDFKLSRGAQSKALVEIKLSTNKRLVHGWESQLPDYVRSEGAHHSVYVVIQVSESDSLIDALRKRVRQADADGVRGPEVVIIDGLPKKSASKT